MNLDEINQQVVLLAAKAVNLSQMLQIPQLKDKVAELEMQTAEPEFWNDAHKAKSVMREMAIAQKKIDSQQSISQRLSDLSVLIEMAKDPGSSEQDAQDVVAEFETLEKEIVAFELSLILNGKYDANNAIFSIAAGVGGTDAQDWAQMLLRMYTRWFEQKGYSAKLVDISVGEEAGIKGATIIVEGDFAYGYLKAEIGVHRLVRLSPFNANNKRQTSFAAVDVIPEIDVDLSVEINPEDLRVDTFRASGAGGQHINKTDSAVRITHLPTGIVVQCQNERSQTQNKETAMKVLMSRLAQRLELEHKEKISELKGNTTEIGWGNQIRSYVFHPYSMVKDHRTNVETANVNGVMDGGLDMFVEAMLRKK